MREPDFARIKLGVVIEPGERKRIMSLVNIYCVRNTLESSVRRVTGEQLSVVGSGREALDVMKSPRDKVYKEKRKSSRLGLKFGPTVRSYVTLYELFEM